MLLLLLFIEITDMYIRKSWMEIFFSTIVLFNNKKNKKKKRSLEVNNTNSNFNTNYKITLPYAGKQKALASALQKLSCLQYKKIQEKV